MTFLLVVIAFVFLQKDFFFSQEEEKTLRFSVVLPDNDLVQQSALREGMEQAAFNYNCELNFSAPLNANDIDEQDDLIQRQLASSPDGVILNPVQINQQREALLVASNKIPIYLVNSLNGELSDSVAISPDYRLMSEKLAERILRDRLVVKKIFLFSSVQTSLTENICEYLELAFAKHNISAVERVVFTANEDILNHTVSVNRKAYELPENVCITLDERALKKLFLETSLSSFHSDNAQFYAWNAGQTGIDYLENDVVKVLVADNQYSIGYVAISRLADQLRKIETKDTQAITFAFIDKNNINSAANQHLLYPIVQ